MRSYRYKPLEGLLLLNKEDYKSVDLLKVLDKVEEEISPSPKGRAKRLMLFFYIIDILQNNSVPLYVKGGLILQYYLGEHARNVNDIDILVPDADDFYHKAQETFRKNNGGLSIEISNFKKEEANEKYYFSTFHMLVSVSMGETKIDTISLEGIYGDLFFEISPKEYAFPSIIKEYATFRGTSLEYIFAEKILAITSELGRPSKHLVDAYSISKIDVDKEELKKYLQLILSFENITRKKVGVLSLDYKYVIKKDKIFTHGFYFPMIQAGYLITIEEMIQEMNQYMIEYLS